MPTTNQEAIRATAESQSVRHRRRTCRRHVRIRTREIHGQFADGDDYTLLAPEYIFEELAYGELAHDNQFSPRVAPAVFGSGLIEAIPEQQILERNDPDDANHDGISGQPNYVWDHLHSRAGDRPSRLESESTGHRAPNRRRILE